MKTNSFFIRCNDGVYVVTVLDKGEQISKKIIVQ
jgi:hypothetical protein